MKNIIIGQEDEAERVFTDIDRNNFLLNESTDMNNY